MHTAPVTPETRHLTASMVVIDIPRHKVLLVHHIGTGKYQFPGGHVDPNETPAETAVREVLEETGVHATIGHQYELELPGMVRRPTPWLTFEIPAPAWEANGEWPAEPAHHHIDELFVGTADSTQPLTAQGDEVHAVVWVDLDELRELPVRAEVPRVTRLAYSVLIVAP